MDPTLKTAEHAGPHRGRILTGDALAVLKTLAAGSYDAAFCDPPYGLEFMGKEWDSFRGEAWRANAGMSKPGIGKRNIPWPSFGSGDSANATCSRCGGRMRGAKRCACDLPAWRVKGKPLGERNAQRDQMAAFQEFNTAWLIEVLRVLKPGAPMLVFGGTRTFHRLVCAIEDAGFLVADTICWLHGQGFPKGHAQLKPAWEPITLAWKKGARVLAIDASRINPGMPVAGGGNGKGNYRYGDTAHYSSERPLSKPHDLGRWPANLILDEEAAAALDAQSGDRPGGAAQLKRRSGIGFHENGSGTEATVRINFGDSGGASRFFYCAKASRKERGEGNTHPTVKPLKLCEYLARLILPPNPDAKLLVPFSGSGSEMIGARRAGWKHVTGIEREREYVEIAQRRMGLQSSPACSPKKLTAAS